MNAATITPAYKLQPGDTVARYIAGRLVAIGTIESSEPMKSGQSFIIHLKTIGQRQRRWCVRWNEAPFYVVGREGD